MQQPSSQSFSDWVKSVFPNYDAKNAARCYAEVLKRRHLAPIDRQREIEIICAQGEPAYGYATYAQILSLEKIGSLCNTILTTNFDDLIADALYMYGERSARPQIITHEALARYVRLNSPRPTIVKLHGDAHLDPKNLSLETEKINDEVARQLYPFLQDSALIFVGYGGNDESVFHFFSRCPPAALASQVYWVGKDEPSSNFGTWLRERNALRVDHPDFDRLMHHLRGALRVNHPERDRWNLNYQKYLDQYTAFEKEIQKQPESVEKSALLQVSEETNKSLPPDRNVIVIAESEPSISKAEEIYREGLNKFPLSAELHNAYGIFLLLRTRKPNVAQSELEKAIELSPENSIYHFNLGAVLLRFGDQEAAAKSLTRCIELSPQHASGIAQYAVYLYRVRRDEVAALESFERAKALGLEDSSVLTHYGEFLIAKNDLSGGLVLLKRAYHGAYKTHLGLRILFHQVAHEPQQAEVALRTLALQLLQGQASYYWDLLPSVERAAENGHRDIEFVRDLAKVVGGQSPSSSLDSYRSWREAKKGTRELPEEQVSRR